MGRNHRFRGPVSSALSVCLLACSGAPSRPTELAPAPRIVAAPRAVAAHSKVPPRNPRPPHPAPVLPAPASLKTVSSQLRQLIAGAGQASSWVVVDEVIQAQEDVRKFYIYKGYNPVWVNDRGALPRTLEMLQAIRESEGEGLEPDRFHLSALDTLVEDVERRRRLQMPVSTARLAEIEVLLTDAFLNLYHYYQDGMVQPSQPDYEWYIPRNDRQEPLKVFLEAIDKNQVAQVLKQALPQHVEYKRLKAALAAYQKMAKAGGWKVIPPGRVLRAGDQDRRVPLLRRRLLVSGDLASLPNPNEKDSEVFDANLGDALKNFQKRNGLKADGVLNASSYAELNLSVTRRIHQLMVNLERWRWLPRDFGNRYVTVNIANYELSAVEDGKTALRMPVIVGNQYKRTPVFSGRMSQVILNPSWIVPRNIVVDSLLSKIKKDPNFLAEHHFSVVKEGEGKQWVPVDPASINWDEIDAENYDLNLRHDPGPGNPLGQVKFVFPNRFSIYLHDTPSKGLFSKTQRTISSGCIRLAKPIELLRFALGHGNSASYLPLEGAHLKEELAKGIETEVPLKRSIPVLMLYQTAWADEQGQVQFRQDIYDKDDVLRQFLLVKSSAAKPDVATRARFGENPLYHVPREAFVAESEHHQ